ncbi:MAG: carboxypeptidase-like regulatory domain-containing protein [Prevotellaceae bacterium]|jgi:hypothetical protein|nr:carboxypeptidase-like regulatory domain-containing protein [Prevotellaceae bacterium]
MRKLFYTFLVLLISGFCFAQQSLYIRGYVLDNSRQGLEFIAVTLQSTLQSTLTNDKGYYELSANVKDSAVTLIFSGMGYKTEFRKIRQTNDKSLNLNVVMRPDTTMLKPLDVSALQKQKDMMVVVETDLLKLAPDAAGGIEALLKMLPGVSSTNEMSSQYSVRGGSFDENSVYVNGIEMYRPLLIRASQQEGLSFINPDMVESVEFSAGGFGAKYGDKMSSALDVKYKIPTAFEGRVSLGTMGATAYVGSSSKTFTQTHGFRYKTNQYLLSDKLKLKNGKPLLKGLDTQGDYSNYFLDYQTFMTYKFSKKWSLEFLGNVSMNNYKFVPEARKTSWGSFSTQMQLNVDYNGQEIDRFATYFGSLSLNFQPQNWIKLSFSTSAFNTNEKETYDLQGTYRLSNVRDDDNGEQTLELLGSGTFHEHARNSLSATVINFAHNGESKLLKTKVQWGISVDKEIISDNIREYERFDSAQYSMPRDTSKVGVAYSLFSKNKMNSTRLQAYLQETYSISFWTFNVGVRANYWTFNEEWLLSPRLSISCLPEWKHNFAFRFAAGVYYQSPFYKEVRMPVNESGQYTKDTIGGSYSIALNRNIRAQRSGHIVFGMDYFFRLWARPFKFTTEIYYKPSDRITTYSVDNVKITYSGINDAIAYNAGVDLRFFGEFVPGADSWIQFSWMKSQENILNDHYVVTSNAGTNLGDVFPGWISRPNEQRYAISIFFQDYVPNHPEYKVNLKLVWADGLTYGPPHSERYKAIYRAKPYRRVDLGVSRGFKQGREKFMSKQKLIKEFWLNIDLLNLFNIENVSSYSWISDINSINYAAPNYLTKFMVNFRISVDF